MFKGFLQRENKHLLSVTIKHLESNHGIIVVHILHWKTDYRSRYFIWITRIGFEPMPSPRKGDVFTTWPTGHKTIHINILSDIIALYSMGVNLFS